MPNRKAIIVVQGGQWGSEGKGMVAAALCREREVDVAVRTGTVNAGHTVYYNNRAYKMQQLPTSWTESDAQMVLGAGAYIHPKTFFRELDTVIDALHSRCEDEGDHMSVNVLPVLVDRNCGIHLDSHTDRSSASGRHYKVGATGKGCSEAVVDKISGRGTGRCLTFRQWWAESMSQYRRYEGVFEFIDTSRYLADAYRLGRQILVEGTQGSHLDLHLGPYPYTTHKQTQAANWVAECGLGLGLEYEVVLVVRTFPIRVAGNSGLMPNEMCWPQLAREINTRLSDLGRPILVSEPALREWEERVVDEARHYPGLTGRDMLDQHTWDAAKREKYKVALSEGHAAAFAKCNGPTQAELKKLFEFTTVTGKLRRLARFDAGMVKTAIDWNGPKTVVLTFWNYWFPEYWALDLRLEGVSGACAVGQSDEQLAKLQEIESQIGRTIEYVTVGPRTEHMWRVR